MTRTNLFRFVLLSLPLMSFSFVHAQTLQSGLAPTLPSASAAAYYYIAKPGELTMQVGPYDGLGRQVDWIATQLRGTL